MEKNNMRTLCLCMVLLICISVVPEGFCRGMIPKEDLLKNWNFIDAPVEQYPSLELRGRSRVVEKGPAGFSIEIFSNKGAGVEGQDEAEGAVVKPSRSLSPEGAFTIELWASPGPELRNRACAYLIDKMGVNYEFRGTGIEYMRDYQIYFGASPNRPDQRRLIVHLGFGEEGGVSTYWTEFLDFNEGQWYHIAFTYDGRGHGRIYVDGLLRGERKVDGRGSIRAGERGLAIGDRHESRYSSFPGYISGIRIHNGVIDVTP